MILKLNRLSENTRFKEELSNVSRTVFIGPTILTTVHFINELGTYLSPFLFNRSRPNTLAVTFNVDTPNLLDFTELFHHINYMI